MLKRKVQARQSMLTLLVSLWAGDQLCQESLGLVLAITWVTLEAPQLPHVVTQTYFPVCPLITAGLELEKLSAAIPLRCPLVPFHCAASF